MRCLTSPYILFSFWAKTKTAKWTSPVPSAHPWAFGKNIGIGFGVGKHFCSVVWSLGIAWEKSPPKIHLDSGSPSKSPTYSNENLPAWTTRKIFHNPRPKNKIPVKHPAQGVQRDGRRPFAVYLASQKRKKSPGNTFPRQKKVFYTCFFQKNLKKAQFPSILSPAVS